jgi:hypothetical protein
MILADIKNSTLSKRKLFQIERAVERRAVEIALRRGLPERRPAA